MNWSWKYGWIFGGDVTFKKRLKKNGIDKVSTEDNEFELNGTFR